MQTIKAGVRQSLFDIAVQHRGRIDAAFEIAIENGLSLDASLTTNTELKIDNEVVDRMIVSYYASNDITPATGLIAGTEPVNTGIGYWTIGTDFIIQ